MQHFTTDELVTATALLVSGIINYEPDESPVSVQLKDHSIYHTDSGLESGPSLIARLGLSREQQHVIREVYDRIHHQINWLDKESAFLCDELYRVRFVNSDQQAHLLDKLAARHTEVRTSLQALRDEMLEEIETILTPAQKLLAARLRFERRRGTTSQPPSDTSTSPPSIHH